MTDHPKSVPAFYTAGYQGRLPSDLRERTGVLDAMVYDIRLHPQSRQPGWNKAELQALLGGDYRHVPALGNRNYASGGPIQIANLDMGLKILLAPARVATGRPAVLLCRCGPSEGCHRSVVADALQKRGYVVQGLVWEPSADDPLPSRGHSRSGQKGLRLGQMTAAEFCRSDRVIRLFSRVLDEEVLVAPDGLDLAHPCLRKRGPRLVYWASEIAEMSGSTPEFVRSLHEVKRVFGTEAKVLSDNGVQNAAAINSKDAAAINLRLEELLV